MIGLCVKLYLFQITEFISDRHLIFKVRKKFRFIVRVCVSNSLWKVISIAVMDGREMPDPNCASHSLYHVVIEIADENETTRDKAAIATAS